MKKSYFISAMMLLTLIACTNDKFEDLSINETKQEEVSCFLSPEEAINIASDAISMLDESENTRGFIDRKVDIDNVKCRVIESTRASGDADTLYYVVNYVDNEGFAIVSADRNDKTPLIAVTESGNYTPGEKTDNPGFDMYIDILEAKMMSPKNTRSGNDGPINLIRTEVTYVTIGEVPYRVRVNWKQQSPYNKYCYNGLTLCPAGCVPTALAQIFSFHKKPTSIYTTFTAPNYYNTNTTITLDWDLMCGRIPIPILPPSEIESLSTGYTANDYVAILMRHIGEELNTNYTNTVVGSGTNMADLDGEWATKFGYQSSLLMNYNWNSVIADLDAGNVTYMQGHKTPEPDDPEEDYIGHAWIIDGYRLQNIVYDYYQEDEFGREVLIGTDVATNYYYHINWGDYGDDNGWFAFDPNDQNNSYGVIGDYGYNLKIITNIKPLDN